MIFNPLNYPPYNHFQLSTDHKCDGEYCLSCKYINCFTPLCRFYGDETIYNPQYLAETSRTTVNGNTEFNVDVAFYQDGLVGDDTLPELTDFTWNQLYGRDLSKIIPIGQKFWNKYDPKETTITQIPVSQAVEMSKNATTDNPYTIGVIVDLLDGKGTLNGQPVFLYHGQALLMGEIWDSYPTNPKASVHPIIWAYKFILKPRIMIEFVHKAGTGEYGLLVSSPVSITYTPASTEADLKARGGSAVAVKPDGTVDYSKARDISL